MNDELLTSRWSDTDSSTDSLPLPRRSWRRGTTGQISTQAKKEKTPLRRRIAKTLGLRKGTKDKASSEASPAPVAEPRILQDTSTRANTTHFQLSEEHGLSIGLARHAKSQEEIRRKRRGLRGPVPRQPTSGEDPRFLNKDANALREELDFLFLAPCEKKVLLLLRGTQRASRFRPLLEPQHELLLVKASDHDNILKAQTLVRELPDDERRLMWMNLHGQLPAHQLYILRLVLFNPEIQITTYTRGSGVESPEPVSRPETTLFFSTVQEIARTDPKKLRWNEPEHSSNSGALVRREASAPVLRLRGGGEDSFIPGSWRSLRTYHDHFRSSRSVQRMEDEERAPTILWWLAGGNNRRGRKLPTGSELRARRAAEKEKRQSVGFFGTVRGVRSRKSPSTAPAVVESSNGDDLADTAPVPPDTSDEVYGRSKSPTNAAGEAGDDGPADVKASAPVDAAVNSSKAASEVDATEAVEQPVNSTDRDEDAGDAPEGETPAVKGGGG